MWLSTLRSAGGRAPRQPWKHFDAVAAVGAAAVAELLWLFHRNRGTDIAAAAVAAVVADIEPDIVYNDNDEALQPGRDSTVRQHVAGKPRSKLCLRPQQYP